MVPCLCVERVSQCHLFSSKELTHTIETYLKLSDIAMPDIVAEITPKSKKKVGEEPESEDMDSQGESEEDNFETPKALRKKSWIISSDDPDFVEKADKFDVDQEMTESDNQNKEGESGPDSRNNESGSESDNRNGNELDLQEFRKVDFTKARRKTKKDKKGFRKEVEERRALVGMGKTNNKRVCNTL